MGILCTTLALCLLDLTTAEARPIVKLLEGMGSALRFTLEHSLVHLDVLGQTTATMCGVSLRLPNPQLAHAPSEQSYESCPFACDVCYAYRLSVRWFSERPRTVAGSPFHRK